VFQPNRYEEPIMLRGVYLSSGTQEGTPIDRLMGTIARTFGLQQQALPEFNKAGRSYFINRLLNDVVFPEAGLAGYDKRVESRRAWLQRGSYAGVLAITALAALAWLTSYSANKSHINQVATSLDEYQQLADNSNRTASTVIDILPRLDALRAASEVASQHEEDVPMHMRLWLYQGGALADAAKDAYIREMNNVFVPFIARDLEQQLRHYSKKPETQYEALKTYLMLGNSERMEPQQVSLWMALSWQNTFPRDPDKQYRLQEHLDTLLQGAIKPALLDKRLVSLVRKNLEQLSLAELAYGRLKYEAMINDHSSFRVTDAVGDAAREVFVRASGADMEEGIPGLFTYGGFHKFYQLESRRFIEQMRAEDWVLADELSDVDNTELQQLDKDIRRLYIADYIRHWENFLDDLDIIPFRNVRHASEVLEVLSGPASPIVGVLESVEHNTALTRLPGGIGDKVKQEAEDSKIKGLFSRLLDAGKEAGIPSNEALPGSRVEQHFQPLNRLVESNNNRPPPVEKLIALLSELYGQLMMLEGGYSSSPISGISDDGGLLNTLRKLQLEGSKQREPVKSWTQQLASHSKLVSFGSAREQLNAMWTTTVLPECEKALKSRYPFHKDGKFDVTIDDFGRFFAPNGKLDQFFQQQLKPLVNTTKNTWEWLSPGQGSSSFSNEALRQMQRARSIREAFFQAGGQVPSIQFQLKPVYLDKSVKRVLLDIGDQRFEYYHGPQRLQDAQWPDPAGSDEVRIVFKVGDMTEAILREDGPWAWFRVLDWAQKKVSSPDRFIATFVVGGRTAKYEIQASSVINPFIMQDLRKFRCPQAF
jgi:type VI secretion system protein ImpL